MPLHILTDVNTQDERWDAQGFDLDAHTESTIQHVLAQAMPSHCSHVEVSVVLCDDGFIQDLNRDYRHKDSPTNVLSFPQTEPDEIESPMPALHLGDIIVSFDTMQREAEEQGKNFRDHYTHMLVHGCLHLLHYDHETDEDAEEMEALEIDILSRLDIKNPYATDQKYERV